MKLVQLERARRTRPPESIEVRKHASSDFLIFRSESGAHLLLVDGSRLYDLDPEVANEIERLLLRSELGSVSTADMLWKDVGLFEGAAPPRKIDANVPAPPPVRSLSLNVAQACNMHCLYCYADSGQFGGQVRMMGSDVARASADRLIAESEPGAKLLLGFMGGEPLLNREVMHDVTRYASRRAAESGREIRFSITTNATTLRREDAELFVEYPFSVQVSVDGNKAINDSARPMNDGSSAYEHILDSLRLFSVYGRPRTLSARVTVTPQSRDLLQTLEHLLSLGFDDVGFAAVLVSPSPEQQFKPDDFPTFLEQMIICGQKATDELAAGRRYPFSNFETAMQEIHRGTHRPYPCGAGAAYLSVNAEGDLFACHRLIDDTKFAMGSVQRGTDLQARREHLARSHVDLMEPCQSCWARYLCGGGCYHEVSRRGRVGCDYIRGWLEFCLKSYVRLTSVRPEYFLTEQHQEQFELSSSITTMAL